MVDVETTGLAVDEARITEIGAVRLSHARPVAEFTALVDPGVPIPPDITSLTGICDATVAGAARIGQVLPEFFGFAAGSVIAAHNAPFDVGFLAMACRRTGTPWPRFAVIDTAMLARLVLGPDDVPDHKLATLASHFSCPARPSHRALADARATAEVLTGLLALLAGRPARGAAAVAAASP